MSELAEPVIRESKLIIGERLVDVECFLSSYTDLKLMLRSRICKDLPVMHTVEERPVRSDRPEVVVRLEEESMPVVIAKGDLFRACLWIPSEFVGSLRIQILDLVFNCRRYLILGHIEVSERIVKVANVVHCHLFLAIGVV